MATKNKTIVLAYSGGLDTSVAIKWLADRYDSEIVTVTADLGHYKETICARNGVFKLGVYIYIYVCVSSSGKTSLEE